MQNQEFEHWLAQQNQVYSNFRREFPRVYSELCAKGTPADKIQMIINMLLYRSQVLTGAITLEQANIKAKEEAMQLTRANAHTQPVYVPDPNSTGIDIRL